jgi:hypothetical protein
MADNLQPYHHRDLTSANLARAYRQLLDMFARYEISATFAFVMAFALTPAERRQFPVLDPSRNGSDPWLKHYWRCLGSGLGEGWHEPGIFELVRESGRHEIASHSFCHRPLGDASISAAGAIEELGNANAAARLKNVELKTLVFPRNEVGNLPAVRSAGYLGFRSRLARPKGRSGRVAALLEEFNIRAGPQPPLERADGLTVIPPGNFFNWRFGLRRLVPASVTKARWRSQLHQCARDGGVVHLWLHPHNLITGPTTAPVLADVLQEVAALRDRGRIEVMTQRAYCERDLGL